MFNKRIGEDELQKQYADILSLAKVKTIGAFLAIVKQFSGVPNPHCSRLWLHRSTSSAAPAG
jgi:hypothetical protein